jgi:hypothetical protein
VLQGCRCRAAGRRRINRKTTENLHAMRPKLLPPQPACAKKHWVGLEATLTWRLLDLSPTVLEMVGTLPPVPPGC